MPTTRIALPLIPHIGHHRAARLERGQMDRLAIEDLRVLAHQQGVAMPAPRRGAIAERHRLPRAVIVEQMRGEDAARAPKRRSASCSAMTSASISSSTCQHALGTPAAVGTDRPCAYCSWRP